MLAHFQHCLNHLYGKLIEIIRLKTPGNYSVSTWINNFSICLCENPKPLISMISGFPSPPFPPQTCCSYFLKHQDTSNKSRRIPRTFKNIIFPNISFWKTPIVTLLEQTRADKWWRSVKWNLEEIGCDINIYQKTRHGNSVNFWNQETLKLWNQQSKKPRNQ